MQPDKFSRYEIREEIGRGGMATVYKAYDPMFEREVALKILNRELLDNAQVRERFERETKIIARLEHSAIVPVYDVGRDNTQLFFVMRYMPGGSLSDRMAAGPMSFAETVHITQRIAAGLDYAHAKGIIHRDLKPGNILFDENGNAFISDFGIAKLAHAQTRLTSSGIIGTPTYMSPEQGMGEDVDGRSDIYSLGVILFEMLSGRLPYEATTPLAMVVKHVNEPVPHILDTNPNLPTAIEMVLEKALAKNRTLRYSTALELARDLAALLPEAPAPDPEYTVPAPRREYKPQKPARKKNLFISLGIIGGILALGLVAINLWQSTPPQAPQQPPTPTLASTPTNTVPAPTVVPATQPPLPTETPLPAPTAIPGIGGADKIALLANNDIWLLDIDGKNPLQLTNSDQPKFDLQWLPGGRELLYVEGECINTVNIDSLEVAQVTCLSSPNFEGFRVSPDGRQAAISIERRVVIVPFDRQALANAKNTFDLQNLNACLDYAEVSVKSAQWSADSQKLTLLYQSVKGERLGDTLRVIDVHRCKAADPLILDEFPNKRFTPDGYETYPILPAYSWDGDQRFLFNTFIRNFGYGQLYLYDMASGETRLLNPVDNVCCYRDARFSPDGTYILLVFQDVRQGADSEIQIYYIPVEQVGSGTDFKPIRLPPLFFPNPREKILPALRPAGQ